VNPDLRKQEAYWDRHSGEFDQIYTHKKPRMGIILDRVFRKDMYDRFRFVLDNSEPIEGKTILDAGCGSGHFSVEFARRRARRVTGIDISANMVRLSHELAKLTKVQHICDFRKSSILDFQPGIKYDVSIAIGLLDYIKDPLPVLAKLRELSQGMIVLSFPRLLTWRAPVRKLRLFLHGCDVYFYSKSRIKALLKSSGLEVSKMKKIGKLYCVVAYPSS
jgi:2-polyprenyl-3-methyl-5-hydroxy-6-metoxy-1,4-benzoquinol methylase